MKKLVPLITAGVVALAIAAGPPASGHAATTEDEGPRVAAAKAPVPHVVRRGLDRVIVDGSGRQLLLRGINTNALVEYPDDFQQTVPMTSADIREMAALGFNFMRLPISWSRLEPAPGAYSDSYVDSILQIIEWAEAERMWVLVDMHQDRYNRNLRPGDEADGAPDWATVTDDQPCASGPLTSPCSRAAYDAFWENRAVEGRPLQTWYRDAVLHLSRALRDHDRLLGIELMNEPTPGTMSSPAWEREQLWPFERALIDALRADGERHMLWFGPNIMRDFLDVDPGNAERFSDDDDLVYAPHIYTGTFSVGGAAKLRSSIDAAVAEARAYGAALVDAEWGGGSDETAEALRAEKVRLLDEYRIGSGFWMWKQRAGFYNWHTVEEDGQLRTDSMRAQMLSQPHVTAVPGQLLRTSFANGVLTAIVRGGGGRAALWSGTAVRAGADSLIEDPLVRVRIDGRRVDVRKAAQPFTVGDTSLLGYRLSVRVPKGGHMITVR